MKMTYCEIDKHFNGKISTIIKKAVTVAEKKGWYWGYFEGKQSLFPLIGWGAQCVDPAWLKSEEAYSLVNSELSEACWRGDAVFEAKRQADLKLERRGIYTHAIARKMTCVKGADKNCNAHGCKAWRSVDKSHGFCVHVGRTG